MEVPTDEAFDRLVTEALDSLPKKYTLRLNNVAILYEDVPTAEQLASTKAGPGRTLLGLYEGLPLPGRGGALKLLPDKITLFKIPLAMSSKDQKELEENIRHTLWHEIAHYFGLDHKQISERE